MKIMKGVWLLLLVLLGMNSNAQQYILVENHGRVHFFDYQSAEYKYQNFKIPRDYLLAEDISGYNFVGYAWELDSLFGERGCYY